MSDQATTEMIWVLLHEGVNLGFLPDFFDSGDPRPAREQIDERYARGGGWRPVRGVRLNPGGLMTFPGDPPFHPLAMTMLRNERIVFYEHDMLAIIQKDGSYEVARID